MDPLEISDLVVSHDPVTLERLPVRRDAVVARLAASGDRRGARIAAGLPCDGHGVLDPYAVDRRLVAVHTELQRLSEELRIGERIAALLHPILTAAHMADPTARLRVVDVGCGLGYLVRWLAASGTLNGVGALRPTARPRRLGIELPRAVASHTEPGGVASGRGEALPDPATFLADGGGPGARPVADPGGSVSRAAAPRPPAAVRSGLTGTLGAVPVETDTGDGVPPTVELIGVDFNAALVAEASRLARAENLPCRFVRGDAFALDEPATVYISTGVLHHFRGAHLAAFFAAQSASRAAAFCHYDIAATGLAPIGAQVFHRARMRDPLGRHDGVVSARRAHDDATLLRAAAHAEGMTPLVYEPRGRSNPFCTTLRPVIGVRPALLPALREALGPRSSGRLVGDLA